MDEHRIGLIPILRRVWAPRGKRPRAVVRPRYEWLYLLAFAVLALLAPSTGCLFRTRTVEVRASTASLELGRRERSNVRFEAMSRSLHV